MSEEIIKDYIRKGTVVNCETISESLSLMKLLNTLGRRWESGRKYTESTSNWDTYKEHTCYNLFLGTFAHKDFYTNKDIEIIRFSSINFDNKYMSKNKIQNEYTKFY